MPPVAALVLIATWGRPLGLTSALVVAVALVAAVLAAVHHAEVVALRVGEPFGSIILAVAVTVIEVGLIVALMISSPQSSSTLARDTVFAAVMITMNGILGLSILAAVHRHGLTNFNVEGSVAALAAVASLATLSLVLPTFTSSEPGPQFTGPQLAFAAVASLTIYAVFILTQTVQHRDFFLPVPVDAEPGPGAHPGLDAMGKEADPGATGTNVGTSVGMVVAGDASEAVDESLALEDEHAAPASTRQASFSLAWLALSLVAVVGLAKVESPAIRSLVNEFGLPQSFVGVVIALIILLPETLAAVRAARRRRLQISINLAFGSALASIGLTIPVIAVASIWLEGPLLLGLGATQIVLLALTLFVTALTVIPGRVTRLQGAMHLAILAGFLVLSIYP